MYVIALRCLVIVLCCYFYNVSILLHCADFQFIRDKYWFFDISDMQLLILFHVMRLDVIFCTEIGLFHKLWILVSFLKFGPNWPCCWCAHSNVFMNHISMKFLLIADTMYKLENEWWVNEKERLKQINHNGILTLSVLLASVTMLLHFVVFLWLSFILICVPQAFLFLAGCCGWLTEGNMAY